MICPPCEHTGGHYYEYEDYDWEFNLHHFTTWYCFGCEEQINQYDEGWVWPDE
jgi:hypothetical protein